MKFTTQIEVVGMKGSKGTLENGQAYDSTKGLCCTNQARSVLELAVLNLTTHH